MRRVSRWRSIVAIRALRSNCSVPAGWPADLSRRSAKAEARSDSTRAKAGVSFLLRRPVGRAFRALAARPGFTLVIIATLALGFGVNAAVFSLTRTVLLRPLPYRDRDRLVQVDAWSRSGWRRTGQLRAVAHQGHLL